MHSLPIFVRLGGQPVVLVGAGDAADAKRRLIERAGGVPVAPDDARAREARLAFVALAAGTPDEIAAALRARGLLINVADRPDLCGFTLPAIVDRDPVIVAVGTGGASAGLAKAVRQRIEALLPAGLGRLAHALRLARPDINGRWADASARRAALDTALADGGALDPLAVAADDEARVAAWLSAAPDAGGRRIETVLLASPDPDNLTLRVARLLGEADRIIHDPAVPAAILARARADAARIVLVDGAPQPSATGLTLILRMDLE